MSSGTVEPGGEPGPQDRSDSGEAALCDLATKCAAALALDLADKGVPPDSAETVLFLGFHPNNAAKGLLDVGYQDRDRLATSLLDGWLIAECSVPSADGDEDVHRYDHALILLRSGSIAIIERLCHRNAADGSAWFSPNHASEIRVNDLVMWRKAGHGGLRDVAAVVLGLSSMIDRHELQGGKASAILEQAV